MSKENSKQSAQDLKFEDDFWFQQDIDPHCPQLKALTVTQYQKSVAYSSTMAGLKPHRTFMGLIGKQDTAA